MKRVTPVLLLIALLAVDPALSSSDATSPLPEVNRQGNGETTILIIPCMSCRWRSFDTFMERNQDLYSMVAVTLPGYGGTPLPEIPRNTEDTPWRENALRALSQLIDDEEMKDVVLVAHSWGSMVAVQLAARRADRVRAVINVDGSLVSSWVAEDLKERLAQAENVVSTWGAKLADAEEWRTFNGGGSSIEPSKNPPTMERHRSVLYHGMFMATDRDALLQYWRENTLIDLTSDLKSLKIPILDIQAIRGDNSEQLRENHLETLSEAGSPENVETIFLYDTSHFVMEHRPALFDRIVADFLAGRELEDFRPE